MIDCDGGGTYEAMQKMGEEQNEDCEHRPEAGRAGAHTTSQMPIEIEIDAQVDAHVQPSTLTRVHRHTESLTRLETV